jgi:hypothetical protein
MATEGRGNGGFERSELQLNSPDRAPMPPQIADEEGSSYAERNAFGIAAEFMCR